MADEVSKQPTLDQRLRAFLSWLGGHEWNVLLALALLLAGTWLFFVLGNEIIERESHPLDEALLLALRNPEDRGDPLGPVWLEEMMRDITALGSTGVVAFITLSVLGYLFLRGNMRTAALVAAAVLGSYLLSLLLKETFARPRPDLVSRATPTFNPSFPSGHSMLAAAAYLTLAALLAEVQPRRRTKAYLLLLGIILTVAVGVSRVYLGVHWPSDVLGGWTAGAVWALLVWLVARRLRLRRDG